MRVSVWRVAPAVVALCALALNARAVAAPVQPAATKRPVAIAHPTSLPGPASIGRVRFEVRHDRVLVTTDLALGRGRHAIEDLSIHVGFGAPGYPIAFDAQILETPPGYLVAPIQATGKKLEQSLSYRSPPEATLHLGPAQMAGMLIKVPASALADRLALTGNVTIRLRELHSLGSILENNGHDIVARLGSYRGTPLVLGLLELVSDQATDKTDAWYCGAGLASARLFVSGTSNVSSNPNAAPLTMRQADDDLCLKFGAAADGRDREPGH